MIAELEKTETVLKKDQDLCMPDPIESIILALKKSGRPGWEININDEVATVLQDVEIYQRGGLKWAIFTAAKQYKNYAQLKEELNLATIAEVAKKS